MLSLGDFFTLAVAHPWAFVAILFNFGVVFINGWTDAPNSIATCITTRCIQPKAAIIMAAIGNLIGTLLIGFLSQYLSTGDVSKTIASIVDFDAIGVGVDQAMIAISFGLLANILFSLGCTYFGFPSSQSNALVGGLTGGAMALACLTGYSLFAAVSWEAWKLVLIGFFGSLFLGFFLGYGLVYLLQFICRKMPRGETSRFFARGQVVSSGLMSIAHGVQDGAKFIGVYLVIAAMLLHDQDSSGTVSNYVSSLLGSWWIVVPVALIITAGTCVGGYKIIKTMGSGMARLHKYQGFATDIASFIGLFLATVFGLPVSTGTVKATAIMGCGAAKSWHQVKWNKAGEMVLSWVLIFPGTAIIAFLLTLLFASIFK
jgi:inorganic phosphate transporter, PiT family